MNAIPIHDITKQMVVMNSMKWRSEALLINTPFVAEGNAEMISRNRRARALTIRGNDRYSTKNNFIQISRMCVNGIVLLSYSAHTEPWLRLTNCVSNRRESWLRTFVTIDGTCKMRERTDSQNSQLQIYVIMNVHNNSQGVKSKLCNTLSGISDHERSSSERESGVRFWEA